MLSSSVIRISGQTVERNVLTQLLSVSEPVAASDITHSQHLPPDTVPQYIRPTPTYPALCGLKARELGITHNLMSSFVTMSSTAQAQKYPSRTGDNTGVPVAEQFGKVMDMDEFLLWISGEDALEERAPEPDAGTR